MCPVTVGLLNTLNFTLCRSRGKADQGIKRIRHYFIIWSRPRCLVWARRLGAWYGLEGWWLVRAGRMVCCIRWKGGAWYGPDVWCLVRARWGGAWYRPEWLVPGTGQNGWCLVRATMRVVHDTGRKGGAWYRPEGWDPVVPGTGWKDGTGCWYEGGQFFQNLSN